MCAREQHGFKKFLCKFISHMLPFLYKEVGISIHAPRVGRDDPSVCRRSLWSCFNPRAPCGARPTPRALVAVFRSFNPRASCGARLQLYLAYTTPPTFQSTRPVWGATRHGLHPRPKDGFQSTRPMRGATGRRICTRAVWPVSIHAPHAGRDKMRKAFHKLLTLSIHAPHAGRD